MEKNVITVTPETPYEEVVRLLYTNNVSGVPVVSPDGKVVGMISEKDIIRVMFPHYQSYYEHPESYTDFEAREHKASDIKDHKASVFMRVNIVLIHPEDPIMKVGATMLAKHMSRLPVVDDVGNIVGVISRRMIYRAIMKENFKI